MKHFIAVALLATLFPQPIPVVWGAQFEIDKIEKALAAPPYVPEQSQNLAKSFLDHTLPKLLADDARLAHQLGFGDGVSNSIMLDRPLAIMVIRREQVLSLIEGEGKGKAKAKANPLDLVNNTNNWLEDEAGRLVPKRIVFLLQGHDSASEAGDIWSSVTMEQSGDGSSWRIIQVGAPKLSQAMNQYGASGGNYFLLWITDLNRHYLGSIKDHVVTLKILFEDRLLNGERGKDQEINPEYLAKLKRLYEDLDLPKKSRPKTDKAQTRTQSP
ncbi:MAG: hypothetical protein ND866_02485 [Pyrinomonadaceae bacterium]|nr:hypothetical protein [Pyrinomonadaceae bacterium]